MNNQDKATAMHKELSAMKRIAKAKKKEKAIAKMLWTIAITASVFVPFVALTSLPNPVEAKIAQTVVIEKKVPVESLVLNTKPLIFTETIWKTKTVVKYRQRISKKPRNFAVAARKEKGNVKVAGLYEKDFEGGEFLPKIIRLPKGYRMVNDKTACDSKSKMCVFF